MRQPLALAAILATFALYACGRPTSPSVHLMKEGEPMSPNATTARPGIPPIDAAVPAKLETATFALG
jgi:hypothetical protein